MEYSEKFPEDEIVLIPDNMNYLHDVHYFKQAIETLGVDAKFEDIRSFIEKEKKEESERIAIYFEAQRKIALDINKEYIEETLGKVIEPFKPFVQAVGCCTGIVDFVLDEEKYKEAASKGEVPTLPIEVDALNLLEERKKTTCCGSKVNKPCLF